MKFFQYEETEIPSKILHDFEKGILNAISEKMPLTKILGCYFHYCQNMWKHMKVKGLSKSYINEKSIRQHFKYLKALCFVPPLFVIKAFKIIQSTAPVSFSPMHIYVEKYYIGKEKKLFWNTSYSHVSHYYLELL